MQPDAHRRRQDCASLNLLPQAREYLLRRLDRVCTVSTIRQRHAKDSHKSVTQKLVNDPVMAVHDLDHELKQRLEILNHFLRTSLLRKTSEVSNIKKHHAHI